MPSSIASFAEFDRRLQDARLALAPLVAALPEDPALRSIARQLDALHGWTRNERCPSQDEKDSLNFGQLASRFVSDIDDELAGELHSLASHIIYWQ